MLRSLLKTLVTALTLAAPLPALAEIVSLQSYATSQSVSRDGSGLLRLGGAPLYLDMVVLEGNRVAFRDLRSGQFLRAGVGPGTELMVASPHIRGWETFELIRSGAYVRLRSVQNGLYVQASHATPRLAARGQRVSNEQLFRLQTASVPVPPLPQRMPFAGQWQADFLFENGRAVTLDPNELARARITIDGAGSAEGSSGCNQIGFQLRAQAGGWRAQEIFQTRMRCYDDRARVEQLFTQALARATRYDLASQGRYLDLRDAGGTVLMRLRRLR